MRQPVPEDDPARYWDEEFGQYYKASIRWAAARAMLLTGRQADAEDITQEAFAAICRKWPEAREWGPAQRDAYVRRALGNLAVDIVRGQMRQRRVVIRLAGTAVHIVRFEDGVLDRLTARSLEVRAVIEQLSPAERVAVVLSDVEGLPAEEIAAMLGVTPSTTRTYLQRAREKLRRNSRDKTQEQE
jgi:RNA polymerase sigma factor (sigma-70 family)